MILYKKKTKTNFFILHTIVFSPYQLDSKIIKVDGSMYTLVSERENERKQII